jgi:hypothetical protein
MQKALNLLRSWPVVLPPSEKLKRNVQRHFAASPGCLHLSVASNILPYPSIACPSSAKQRIAHSENRRQAMLQRCCPLRLVRVPPLALLLAPRGEGSAGALDGGPSLRSVTVGCKTQLR